MYAALLAGKLVLAKSEEILVRSGQKTLNRDNYRCPRCHKRVLLGLAQKRSAFFYHLPKNTPMTGEKAEHLQLKLGLKAALAACGWPSKIEAVLADGEVRADILASSKLAFEIQCAPLSLSEYRRRHLTYRRLGIQDIWIVGRRHYLKPSLKQSQLIYFRHNEVWGDYYLECDSQKQRLYLRHHVLEEPIRNRLVWKSASFSIDEQGLAEFWEYKAPAKTYSLDARQQKAYLYDQLRRQTRLGLKIGEELYLKGLSIEDLPDAVFGKFRRPGASNCVSQFLQKKEAP